MTVNSKTIIGTSDTIPSSIPDGYILVFKTATGLWTPVISTTLVGSFTPGGDLGGSGTSQQVLSITGNAGVVNIASTANIFTWNTATTTPGISQADKTTNAGTGETLTIQSQNETGTTSTGGSIVLSSGTGTTTHGAIKFQIGSNSIPLLDVKRNAVAGTVTVIDSKQQGLSIQNNVSSGYIQFTNNGASPQGIFFDANLTIFRTGNGGTTKGNWNSSNNLRIGDATSATEKLEVLGNIKYDTTTSTPKLFQADNTTNGATAQATTIQAQNATGTTSTGGALTLTSGTGTTAAGVINLQSGGVTNLTINSTGATTTGILTANSGGTSPISMRVHPSNSAYSGIWCVSPGSATNANVAFYGNSSDTVFNAPTNIYFQLNGGNVGRINSNNWRLGDATAATERLEVLGNIKIDTTTSTPKIYQADNTTNSATATTLTIQAQNATGTTATGGALTLTSGTGTTVAGNINLQTGGVTRLQITPTGSIIGTTISAHQIIGSQRYTVRSLAANLTIDTTTTDCIILVDTSSARAITLPTATSGRIVVIKDKTGQAGTNNITITRAGSESIEGVAGNYIMSTNFQCTRLVSDGTNWFVW